ncbi:hypothetical protein E2562_014921 [Oryza meyeriana var. granulata]|uniref:RING-type E3 ubiquitin transferase n=1 Tax=Oryza meyeriana var. granulata TaxID=110450 RepID=A0A6G1EIB9_9ORYZ|nr:hypothetical protein E2562_014921 [Oryza meyeriana var. granulata]
MGNDDNDATKGLHEQTTGCLPVDQSCFALSRLSYRSSSKPRVCCSTTSYLEVLAISFASLLAILLVLCVIRCYLMRRAVNRVTVAASAAAAVANVTKKRPARGLDEDAITALPKFEYRGTGDECDLWECAICLSAMADGEVARQLPRCMHLFHRGCIDMWLVAHTTCPVCRAEVVVTPPDDGRCAERPEAEAAPPATAPEPASALIGEYDGLALELVVFSLAVVVLRYAAVLYANHLVDSLSELHAAVGAGMSNGGDRRGSWSGGGLDSAAIARLPCFVLSRRSGGSGGAAAAECAVCLGAVEEGETVRALPCCPHAFHARCVDAWLRLRPTCPLCRAAVPVPVKLTASRARHVPHGTVE